MRQSEQVEYLLSQKGLTQNVTAFCEQYGIPRSTLYYWHTRYELFDTYENQPRTPIKRPGKITDAIKAAVLKKHQEYHKLGCWRLSLF